MFTKVYIGLDQAVANTGFAIYRMEAGSISYGTFVQKATPKNPHSYIRFYRMAKAINDLVESHSPTLVFIEEAYFNRKSSVTTSCIEFKAVLLCSFVAKKQSYEILPSDPRVKLSWTNQLGLTKTKTELQEKLKAIGITVGEHEADAIGVLWGGLTRLGLRDKDSLFKVSFTNLGKLKVAGDIYETD